MQAGLREGGTMNLESNLNWADEKTARRALLSVSLLTTFLANLHIGPNNIKISTLIVRFDQAQVVAFGQLATCILLIIFLIRMSTRYIPYRNHLTSIRENSGNEKLQNFENEIMGHLENDEIRTNEDLVRYEQQTHKEKIAAEKLKNKVIELRIDNFSLMFVDTAIPIAISLLTIIDPKIINGIAGYFFI
jgi:hypothetical protein